jgi:nucleotide-binding universal stress UspA family protein
MMRGLLAYDGSPDAQHAVALADTLAWPTDSTLRVVTAVEPTSMIMVTPWSSGALKATLEVEAQALALYESAQADLVRRIERPGLHLESAILRGRPATVLVEEASTFGADVMIVGSRGQGTIAELVLGSVSAEVVEHAACPVLVARTPAVRRILFASDGSSAALAAEALLAEWPIFNGLPIEVVSVADVVRPWHTGIAPTMYQQVLEAHAKDLETAQADHDRVATSSAARLQELGRDARSLIRTGDPATEIIAAAAEDGADLIVIGSRGLSGLSRILLGSVARNVIHGSAASVLVVRAEGDA